MRYWLAVPIAAASVVVVLGNPASGGESDAPESHCVIRVIDQLDSGELMVTEPSCYLTFQEAMVSASDGALARESVPESQQLTQDPATGSLLRSFTLGIHYDGANGSGSSISVVGGSCTGGYWNTGLSWANRITSSWNGCHRLRHHDFPNKSGTFADTVGAGTHNLASFMNNKTESVSYWGS